MSTDNKYMKLALEQAELGRGNVSPNPLVGCVIVKEDNVIATGYHKEFGGPHAEVDAVSKVEGDLRGCTVYVTLEPCTHHGKTPPCADLLIEKKPDRVVIAMEDPNPIVKGNGVSALKGNGIETSVGILENEAKVLNRVFITNMLEKRPFVTAKFAMTLDGYMAQRDHESKWISCEASRIDVHKFRSDIDAIMVGSGTVRQDNPMLDVRLAEGRNPKRVVLASHLQLPLSSHLLKDENAKENTIIYCTNEAQNIKLVDQMRSEGLNVKSISKNTKGKVDVSVALRDLLKEYHIGHIMLEGGAKLFSEFYELDFIDEIITYQSPKILGSGISPFEYIRPLHLSDDSRFRLSQTEVIDSDIKAIWVRK
ncbi:MAG: bifunctional diaminohydroxyphosphoribosylaminopyrimidine deaminase/5-amino-6-(5-phosphoribosylamino)uracil reductase RibD [Candidatus Kapaibacterium sp.]